MPAALAADLPLTLVNLPAAPHAFDLDDDCAATRSEVEQILDFLRAHVPGVLPSTGEVRPPGQ